MDNKSGKLDLSLPEQKLSSLSFCEASPKPFEAWVEGLPIANVGESARRLYHAIIELNQLETSAQLRLRLLGLLRPQVHFVCRQLAQHFLGQSIAMTEKQRKVANLAQALQLHMANGFKLALSQLIESGVSSKNRDAVVLSCHRAICDLSQTILRACQLYCPSPSRAWYETHQIFRFALDHEVDDRSVTDGTRHYRFESTIEDAYKQLLLLGCCRPNQLRQHEMEQTFQLFECWTDLTDVHQLRVSQALFVIATDKDSPPIYRNLLKTPLTRNHLGFDSTPLADALAAHLSATDRRTTPAGAQGLEMPVSPSDALLMHLSQALGILTKRSFKRMSSSGTLQVCVGMTALHYYCADQTTFNEFVNASGGEDEENIFLGAVQRKNDAWAGAFDAGKTESLTSPDTPIEFRGSGGDIVQDRDQKTVAYPWHEVTLENTSPGGYCLNWQQEAPNTLQTGEVLGVREQPDHPWSVAIIRWIQKMSNQGTQIGVELLAPNARPVALRVEHKVGQSSEFLRGLLLPELSIIGQPSTLLTPRVPFRSGNQTTVLIDQIQHQAQLNRRVSATSSISQFELTYRQPPEASNQPSAGVAGPGEDDDFDSLWDSL